MKIQHPVKLSLGLIWLAALLAGIVGLFWYQEWKYQAPTPIPEGYEAVAEGTLVSFDHQNISYEKPVFIHFFNPDCPCSRFNLPYFKSLVKKYGATTDFRLVLMNDEYNPKEVQRKYDLNIPVLTDTSLARKCGIYSTPQAVILDPSSRIFYSGNYNKTRYCSDEKTNYAEHALQAMLGDSAAIVLKRSASVIYGCSLPKCTKP